MSMQEDLDQNITSTENESEELEPTTDPVATTDSIAQDSPEQGEDKPHRKVRTGVVVSNKMDKSILVRVTRRVRHPLYKKYFFKSKNFMAHDENNECNEGDTVRIVETRPLSARKRWRLEEIVERAK